MRHLRDKIAEANEVIAAVTAEYRRPAVMFSGGKDSMVLLFMLRARNLRLPVIMHREPWFPAKYAFVDRIIREWDLVVYDWPPVRVGCQKERGLFEIVNHYQVHAGGTISLPKNIYDPAPTSNTPAGEPWLCGLDMIRRPLGTFDYPWDAVFHGHKSSDRDPLMGRVELLADIVPNVRGPALAFPLRNWTDEDIWEYSRAYTVPQQEDRYDRATGQEREDKRLNPDHWAVCTRCMDADNERSVWCPKLKREIGNVSHQMPMQAVGSFNYINRKD